MFDDFKEPQSGIGAALREMGWTLYGWTDDESDTASDLYAPAHWDGIATKGDCVAVVHVGDRSGVLKNSGGHTIEETVERIDRGTPKTCERCNGSKVDPSGWTLAAARADEARFHRERMNSRYDVLCPGFPWVKWFDEHGAMKCRTCFGAGTLANVETIKHETRTDWPTFSANPRPYKWHVERRGEVIAKGRGLKAPSDAAREEEAAHYQSVARKIDDAATAAAQA